MESLKDVEAMRFAISGVCSEGGSSTGSLELVMLAVLGGSSYGQQLAQASTTKGLQVYWV
jgi:hypothetical protein